MVLGEQALVDLKEIKIAKCKIHKIVRNGRWLPGNGAIPTRNVDITTVPADELLANVVPISDAALHRVQLVRGRIHRD